MIAFVFSKLSFTYYIIDLNFCQLLALKGEIRYNKTALPLCGKNLVIRAFLVEGVNEVRPHNKDASVSLVEGASEARPHNE